MSKKIKINGIEISYREAGEQNKETILLLHGFPSSSHMYRDIIKLLSDHYHLIAPDYPGFGLSETPSIDKFEYTFENISETIEKFIDTLKISSFYLMMQDYGGPIGFRIASKRPQYIKGLIIQNANMYMEGMGEWAKKIGGYQKANDLEGLNNFKNYLMSLEGIKEQYLSGSKHPEKIDPISYTTDAKFMEKIGINEVQTALFYNYGTNFPKYPEWQNYLKEHQPKTLVVWGENDKFFSKHGGAAYSKDLDTATIHFFEGGHFMLEEYSDEVAELIKEFIK
ncbi:alpha/beta fold hydrolase [Flavivirga rizhaonensis]|uniref:Alpha/beta hydrolase n=1 Tax=Flavivirga rizhaonensis TaxID=2559571 RepID=A0A4S1DRM6_9FLAO|nr:alpha/beta hydrolase [Flavivirga rizhaonensis]TGV00365.1 alpha/beta hydrolase [Flavivirga rizhaonensis]